MTIDFMKYIPFLLLLTSCSQVNDNPQERLFSEATNAQRIATESQEMLKELIRENPGIEITNYHWWAEHASTKEARESYRYWAEVFDHFPKDSH